MKREPRLYQYGEYQMNMEANAPCPFLRLPVALNTLPAKNIAPVLLHAMGNPKN